MILLRAHSFIIPQEERDTLLVKGTGERGRENPLLQYPLLLKGGGESRVSFLGRKGRKGEEVRGKKERTEEKAEEGRLSLFTTAQ